ncbi:hypothetical protein BDW22DRAFT_1485741 [Trametopsis cervina]|nr:hypothetical protein BDW22DRAFT_1485741 [Trametopsis cervina]
MDPHDRYSDDSESSDPNLNAYLDDRNLARQRSPTPPSSRTPPLSQGGHNDHRNRKRDRDRHSEVLKMLMNEEQDQSRSTRKFLRTALARLDNETLRAQKAEQHALEIAQRFKVISDAHRQLQGELNRVHEELRLYKVQYDNAQREIHRGQDILKTLEAQRDDAEARAAKDRTTARRLKEEQLMNRAREEGRRAGYAEGLKKGLEQARFERLRSAGGDSGGEEGADLDSAQDYSRADALDDLQVRNLTSPSANVINIESPVPQHIIPPLSGGHAPPQEQGSRFREHGIGATPGVETASLASTSQPWPPGRPTSVNNGRGSPRHQEMHIPPEGWIPPSTDGIIRLPPPHEMQPPPSPHSPSQPLPIPLRPRSSSSRNDQRDQQNATDYGYRRNSAGSVSTSIPSTTFSQFDIVSAPSQPAPPPYGGHGHNRNSSLSVIQEVSSSMEYSPGMDSRGIPEPVVFPTANSEHMAAADQFPFPGQRPRSRQASQRLADDLRYDEPDAPQHWRQSGELRSSSSRQSLPRHHPSHLTTPAPLSPVNQPREMRPASAASGASGQPYRSHSVMSRASDVDSSVAGRRPASSSQEWVIDVVPPSGPSSSTFSPVQQAMSMLSPSMMPETLPPQVQPAPPPIPTAPNSPSMGRYPSMGALPDVAPGGIPKVNHLPVGFLPTGPVTPMGSNANLDPAMGPVIPRTTTPSLYGPPKVPGVQRSVSSSSSGTGRNDPPPGMHSRSRSAGGPSFTSAMDDLRSKTPGVARPSSAASNANRPTYATAPTPSGVLYPAPPGASMSPRSAASRLSGGQQRGFSLNAGSTPAPSTRPLSTAPPPKLRRIPSDTSFDSAISGHSEYERYKPSEYVDPAFLASSEDLNANVFSPNTAANTRVNSSRARKNSQPSGSRNSPSLSYSSLQR